MAYKIIVSPRTQKEIENTIDYYALYSINAPVNFIIDLKEAYGTLETNPFFRICYKNVRALKLKRFPHSLYFVINEEQNTVRVLSCFHSKRNPNKRPRL
jgi:toxin ParE1/3/4